MRDLMVLVLTSLRFEVVRSLSPFHRCCCFIAILFQFPFRKFLPSLKTSVTKLYTDHPAHVGFAPRGSQSARRRKEKFISFSAGVPNSLSASRGESTSQSLRPKTPRQSHTSLMVDSTNFNLAYTPQLVFCQSAEQKPNAIDAVTNTASYFLLLAEPPGPRPVFSNSMSLFVQPAGPVYLSQLPGRRSHHLLFDFVVSRYFNL